MPTSTAVRKPINAARQEDLEGRFKTHFEESQGDLERAQALSSQELQEGVQRIESEVQVIGRTQTLLGVGIRVTSCPPLVRHVIARAGPP